MPFCRRRMCLLAAHLVDGVFGDLPVRHWVLTLPHRLRYKLACDHRFCLDVLAVFRRGLLVFERRRAHAEGIVGASSHIGRRWFMTELARAGVHPRAIQMRARHSSLATTRRYIEVTPDQERRAVRAIRF